MQLSAPYPKRVEVPTHTHTTTGSGRHRILNMAAVVPFFTTSVTRFCIILFLSLISGFFCLLAKFVQRFQFGENRRFTRQCSALPFPLCEVLHFGFDPISCCISLVLVAFKSHIVLVVVHRSTGWGPYRCSRRHPILSFCRPRHSGAIACTNNRCSLP